MAKLLAKCTYITSKTDMEVVTSEEGTVYRLPSETDRYLACGKYTRNVD